MDDGGREPSAAEQLVGFGDILELVAPIGHVDPQNPHNVEPPLVILGQAGPCPGEIDSASTFTIWVDLLQSPGQKWQERYAIRS